MQCGSQYIHISFVIFLAIIWKVHCVYGQSRSAAVILAYLLSLGESIHSAINLLKEKRQIICINPGFLAQLFLLSMKGFHAPEIQLIVQNPLRYDSTKLSNAGNASDEKSFAKSDYVDSYKPIIEGKKRPLSGAGIEIDEANSNSSSCIGERLPDSDPSLCADTLSEGNVNSECNGVEELTCGQCGFVLAREENIVRATLYADFLSEHTDDYWAGYRPIHPSIKGVVALESSQPSDKKRVRQNIETKARGKRDALCAVQKCVTMSVVGPMEWITQQIESRRIVKEKKAFLRVAVGGGNSQHAAAPEGGVHDIKLACPSCQGACGYCVRGGLEICQSFLRCDLLALTSATIKRTQQVMSYSVAQLHDAEV